MTCQRCDGLFGEATHLVWNDIETLELAACRPCAEETKKAAYLGTIHIVPIAREMEEYDEDH